MKDKEQSAGTSLAVFDTLDMLDEDFDEISETIHLTRNLRLFHGGLDA